MLEKARSEGIETAFDRAVKMNQCGFGATGFCCKHCLEGPCRIVPNGKGAQVGVCGANVDTIVARNFLTNVTEGAASHTEHAREVAHKALEDFQKQHGTLNWLQLRAQIKSVETWKKLGLLPVNAHLEIARSLARQVMGGDADPANILLGAVTIGLVDGYAGLHLSTDLQDILFGTPRAVKSQYRLGVIKEDMVNITVHGHIPLLSEKVVEWAGKLIGKAKEVVAQGINVVGVCCSDNEVLMRGGVPVATNYASQELPIVTGALEAMVVDIQCIMPGLQTVRLLSYRDHYHPALR